MPLPKSNTYSAAYIKEKKEDFITHDSWYKNFFLLGLEKEESKSIDERLSAIENELKEIKDRLPLRSNHLWTVDGNRLYPPMNQGGRE